MKHVREELPDVRAKRPEVSAILAAVVERATAKELGRRYASDEELIADLEDSLAIETARGGVAPGEATTVLRTLPRRARRRVPLRMRHPGWLAAGAMVAIALAALLAIEAGRQAQRGTGTSGASRPPGLEPVSLGQNAARDFDPFGDHSEHPLQTAAVLDRDLSTFWSTERYDAGFAGKPGVGIILDASPGYAAREMEVHSLDTGWTAEVYAARQGPPEGLDGWQRVSSTHDVTRTPEHFDLDTAGQRFNYYLLWITKLPDAGQVKISEIYLSR
jgi:hypothetical protein